MSNLMQFPNPRKIREEACAWIARIDAGLSADDKSALDKWLAASPQHVSVLLEMGKLWDEMDVMTELSELFPLNGYERRDHAPRSHRREWLAAAALGGVAVLAWWGIGHFRLPEGEASWQTMTADYETAVGEQKSVQLVDGTTVMLNTNTRVEVQFAHGERNVILARGEASFDVAHDSEHPFDVYAGKRVVHAVGTIFNVQLAANDDVEIAVTEGRIRVTRRDPSARESLTNMIDRLMSDRVITAGEAVVVKNDQSTVRELQPEDIDAKLAWQRGMLVFRGEPLDAVLREVGRYTTVDFELADRKLATLRVGGYFRVGEIDGLLMALQDNFNIRAERRGDHIILTAN